MLLDDAFYHVRTERELFKILEDVKDLHILYVNF